MFILTMETKDEEKVNKIAQLFPFFFVIIESITFARLHANVQLNNNNIIIKIEPKFSRRRKRKRKKKRNKISMHFVNGNSNSE